MQLLEMLLKTLRQEKARIEHVLLHGSIRSYEEYRYNLGRLKGVDDSIEITIRTLSGEQE